MLYLVFLLHCVQVSVPGSTFVFFVIPINVVTNEKILTSLEMLWFNIVVSQESS